MSRNGKLELFFFEGRFEFQLKIGELILLEETRLAQLKPLFPALDPAEVSIGRLYERLTSGKALIDDTRQTLRLGLVGAGMEREGAHDLVARHCVGGQLLECMTVAAAVLGAAMIGNPDDTGDPPGEGEGGKGAPAAPPPPGAGPSSTGKARRSGGRRGR